MARADLGVSIGMPKAKWTGATAIVVKVSGIRAEVTAGGLVQRQPGSGTVPVYLETRS